MRAMADEVVGRCLAHIASLDRQPACGDVDAAALCRSMRENAPEHGTSLDALLDPLFRDWVPRSFTAPGPGYLAYIPGGGIFPAALADFIADTTNRYTGVWQAAPALVQLEANALDWLRDWMGFPPETRGLFTAGGYCGHGVAMAAYLGEQIACRIAGEPIDHPLLDDHFPVIPMYTGDPWFLPLAGAYYHVKDWLQ